MQIIKESVNGKLKIKLIQDGKVLLEDESINAGIEISRL